MTRAHESSFLRPTTSKVVLSLLLTLHEVSKSGWVIIDLDLPPKGASEVVFIDFGKFHFRHFGLPFC